MEAGSSLLESLSSEFCRTHRWPTVGRRRAARCAHVGRGLFGEERRTPLFLFLPARGADVNSALRAVVSIVVALFVGFTISFVVSPDPTGLLPVAVGVVLTGVLVPVFYFGIRRLSVSDGGSTRP